LKYFRFDGVTKKLCGFVGQAKTMNKALLYRDFPEFPVEQLKDPAGELDLLARHDLYFETRQATTPALIETAQALRYQVYCLERKFENAQEHARGLESDEYDAHAVQGVLFHRPTGEGMGTVRLVLPVRDDPFKGLPVMRLLSDQGINLEDYVPTSRAVEVSRFAISKNFRRRVTDNMEPEQLAKVRQDRVKQGNLPCLSLIQFLLRQSVELGVTHWTAVMEVKLLRMLDSMGIHFTSLGTAVMHHGLRQPCYCYLPKMLDELKQEQKDYWDVITNAGLLHDGMQQLRERV
jgi:N-acyl amino acid synthase of PEP-CTERM/exosortase system